LTRSAMALALLLPAGAARAAQTVSFSGGYACPAQTVNLAGGTVPARCGAAGGARYLYGRGNFWSAGLDYSYSAFADKTLRFNSKAGQVQALQLIFQHDFETGAAARPYFQLGAGAGWTKRHTSAQPIDLAVSGALGLEFGGDGLVGGFEVRALHLQLEKRDFGKSAATVVTPSLRVGWRFK
jgi:hypothetical protein